MNSLQLLLNKTLVLNVPQDLKLCQVNPFRRREVRDPDRGQRVQGLHEAPHPQRDPEGLHGVQVRGKELARKLGRDHQSVR